MHVYSELDKKEDIYHSMLAEAYFVLLLYTVVELYGKPSADVEEDYRCGPVVEEDQMAGGLQVQKGNENSWKDHKYSSCVCGGGGAAAGRWLGGLTRSGYRRALP